MASPKDSDRLPTDPAFKAIYSFPRMIADALRGYAVKPNGPLDPRTVAALDFRTLRKLPAEWVTPDFRRRIGDPGVAGALLLGRGTGRTRAAIC